MARRAPASSAPQLRPRYWRPPEAHHRSLSNIAAAPKAADPPLRSHPLSNADPLAIDLSRGSMMIEEIDDQIDDDKEETDQDQIWAMTGMSTKVTA
jgi:hypothetical protein